MSSVPSSHHHRFLLHVMLDSDIRQLFRTLFLLAISRPWHWRFMAPDLFWGLNTLAGSPPGFPKPAPFPALQGNCVKPGPFPFFTCFTLLLADSPAFCLTARIEAVAWERLWPWGARAFCTVVNRAGFRFESGHTLASCVVIGDNYLTSMWLVFFLCSRITGS